MHHTTHGDHIRAELLQEYSRLIKRFGFDAVMRHIEPVKSAIDSRLEQQSYDDDCAQYNRTGWSPTHGSSS